MRRIPALLSIWLVFGATAQTLSPMAETRVETDAGRACHVIFPGRIAYVSASEPGMTAERTGVDGRMLRVTLRKESAGGSITVQTEDGTVYPIRIAAGANPTSGVYRMAVPDDGATDGTSVIEAMERIARAPAEASRMSEVRQEGVCLSSCGVFLHEGYFLVRVMVRNASPVAVCASSARIASRPKGRLRETAYTEEEIEPRFSSGIGQRIEPGRTLAVVLAVEAERISSERRYRTMLCFTGSTGETGVDTRFNSASRTR